jgi:hypothetical protein
MSFPLIRARTGEALVRSGYPGSRSSGASAPFRPTAQRCWSRIVDLALDGLESIDPTKLGEGVLSKAAVRENIQTREIFAGEATLVATNRKNIVWHRPSRDELDARAQLDSVPLFDISDGDGADTAEIPITEIVGSSTRGTILHKLMEEVLNSEISDRTADLEIRAGELLTQLGMEPARNAKDGISPAEVAATLHER